MVDNNPKAVAASRVIFLLGAGASVPAGIPTMKEFTNDFKKDIIKSKKELKELYLSIEKKLNKTLSKTPDLENMLNAFDIIAPDDEEYQSIIDSFYELKSESTANRIQILELKKMMINYIKLKTFVKDSNSIEYLKNIRHFIDVFGPLHIFSVNYDTCIELFSENYLLEYTDGFSTIWDETLFSASKYLIKLYKLHGSVLWYQTKSGRYFKSNLFHTDYQTQSYMGEDVNPLLVYPLRDKSIVIQPLHELFHQFRNRLKLAEYCIIIGYSFRDTSITTLLRETFRQNPVLQLIIVSPNAGEYYNNLINIDKGFEGRIVPIPSTTQKIFDQHRLYHFIRDNIEGYQKYLELLAKEREGKDWIATMVLNWIECAKKFAECHHGYMVEQILNHINWSYVGTNTSDRKDISMLSEIYIRISIYYRLLGKNEMANASQMNARKYIEQTLISEIYSDRGKTTSLSELPNEINDSILRGTPSFYKTNYTIHNNIGETISSILLIIGDEKERIFLEQIDASCKRIENLMNVIEKLRNLINLGVNPTNDVIKSLIDSAKEASIQYLIPSEDDLKELPKEIKKIIDHKPNQNDRVPQDVTYSHDPVVIFLTKPEWKDKWNKVYLELKTSLIKLLENI